MSRSQTEVLTTPHVDDLGLKRIVNPNGLSIGLLPNGAVFSLEHVEGARRIVINQTFASPIAGGMGRLLLRIGGADPAILACAGADAARQIGAADDRFVWEGEERGVLCRAMLWLAPNANVWLWRLAVVNRRAAELPCDALFIQDLGLADPAFLMSNEAYACQYLDHFVADHPRAGSVVMSRQNLAQGGAHPWTAHGCLDGAAGFATDLRELMGPACRDADGIGLAFGAPLSSQRLQYETGCAALQSKAVTLAPGEATTLDLLRRLSARSFFPLVRRRSRGRRRGRTDRRKLAGAKGRACRADAHARPCGADRRRRSVGRSGDRRALSPPRPR